jgi:hypothetical protein
VPVGPVGYGHTSIPAGPANAWIAAEGERDWQSETAYPLEEAKTEARAEEAQLMRAE